MTRHYHRYPFVPPHPRNLRAFVLAAIGWAAVCAMAPYLFVILAAL